MKEIQRKCVVVNVGIYIGDIIYIAVMPNNKEKSL